MIMASFEVGQLFSDYKDIEILVKSFEDTNFVKLYKKESCTIEAARKRSLDSGCHWTPTYQETEDRGKADPIFQENNKAKTDVPS